MKPDRKPTDRDAEVPTRSVPATGKRNTADAPQGADPEASKVEEIGGRKGPDPTRYGDWEKDGRCVDF